MKMSAMCAGARPPLLVARTLAATLLLETLHHKGPAGLLYPSAAPTAIAQRPFLARRHRLTRFPQAGDEIFSLRDRHRRTCEGVANRFESTTEVPRKERFCDGKERDVVFRPGEAMALIRKQHIRHRNALRLHRLDDLIR